MQQHRNIGAATELSYQQWKELDEYLAANQLLLECLNLAAVTNREASENLLLLPPEEKTRRM